MKTTYTRCACALTAAFCLSCLFASCSDPKEEAQKELLRFGVISSVLDVGSPVGAAALLQAISQHNTDIAGKLLTAGVSPDASVEGISALLCAISKDETSFALSLIELGADVNGMEGNHPTPLMEAAFRGQKDVVESLLAHHADMNAKDDGGWTALTAACAKSGKTAAFMKELLAMKGLDETDEPIRLSAYAARTCPRNDPKLQREIVQRLIEAGAKNSSDFRGLTPLCVAACEGRPKMVKQLAALPADGEGRSVPPLLAAVWCGHDKTIHELIAAKADVRADYLGTTPLYMAAYKKRAELIPVLVKAGADVRKADMINNPLDIAVEQQDMPTVKALVEAGAEMNPHSELGSSVLASAVVHYSPEIFDYLLAHGSNPNDDHALTCAINWGRKDCFARLLQCKELMVAAEKKEPLVIRLIRSFEHTGDNLLRQAANRANVKISIAHPSAENLVEMLEMATFLGANINATDSLGNTALHRCMDTVFDETSDRAERIKVAHALIQAGANVNATNESGTTPLGVLVSKFRRGNQACDVTEELALLLRNGADPNLSDGKDTPLHNVLELRECSDKERCRLVRLLIEAGADVNAKDSIRQQTPLHALFRNHYHSESIVELTKLLVEGGALFTVQDRLKESPLDELERKIKYMKKGDAEKVIAIMKSRSR